MKREIRNPKSHRHSEQNDERTFKVMETYQGKAALLATWEKESDDVQADNHDYILGLRATVRRFRSYLLHRADAKTSVG